MDRALLHGRQRFRGLVHVAVLHWERSLCSQRRAREQKCAFARKCYNSVDNNASKCAHSVMSVSLSPEQLAVLRELRAYKYKLSDEADKVFGETRDYDSVKLNDLKKLLKHEVAANPAFNMDAAKSFIDIKGTVHLPSAPKIVDAPKTTSVPRQKDAAPAGKQHRLRNIIAMLVKNQSAALKAKQ